MAEETRLFQSDDGDSTVNHEPVNPGAEVSDIGFD